MLKKMGWEEGDGLGKINYCNIFNSTFQFIMVYRSVDNLSLFKMNIIQFLRKLDQLIAGKTMPFSVFIFSILTSVI